MKYQYLLICAILVLLTGCAELPVTLAIRGNHGTYSYSEGRGIEVAFDALK